MTCRQARSMARRNSIKEQVMCAFYALLTALLIANWFTGCGTFTRTIEGEIIHGSCVFIPAFAIHTPVTPQ